VFGVHASISRYNGRTMNWSRETMCIVLKIRIDFNDRGNVKIDLFNVV
jgi:hypothetical protein